MKSNMIAMKIKYVCEDSLLRVIEEYNSVLRYTYNRLFENNELKTAEITQLQKGLNNCELIGSHLRNSAIYDVKGLIKRSEKSVIFGGKSLYLKRCQNKIENDAFYIKRLQPLCSVGESYHKGNRLFEIKDNEILIFKLDRKHHYELKLQSVGKNYKKYLNQLIDLQNNKQIALTYKLDLDYVYIIFDYNLLKSYKYKVKENRVFAIDLNPNTVGWSVVDWKDESSYHVIQSGTYKLKALNDYRKSLSISSDSDISKYVTNKRKHEVIHIVKELFSLCKHYGCEVFAIEDLTISSKDNGRGRSYNRLVNNMWCRDLFIQQVRKYIKASTTVLVEVMPQYNSYIGNLIYRKEQLPDECLASIEIGRRGYEFAGQYIFKRRSCKKTVIFPELGLVKKQLILSLEELGIDVSDNDLWKDILSKVKKSKVKYRFSTDLAREMHKSGLFSKFYKRKYLEVYNYL